MKTAIPYNPAVLEAAAKRAGGAVWQQFPALEDWINQKRSPTLLQLSDFAKKAHIPFGYLFLGQLPKTENTVPFFRRGKDAPVYEYSPELTDTLRAIHRRLDWLDEYLQQEGEAPLDFIGSLTLELKPVEAAAHMRRDLGLTPDWMKALLSGTKPLRALAQAAESTGVFIAKNGVVENNSHATLNPDEFRGFALVGRYAAYVFLNTKAPEATHLFTLAHELVHVWLGKSAISDSTGIDASENRLENWCDAVAAELLVPERLLVQDWEDVKTNPQPLRQLNRMYGVNEVILARRLRDVAAYSEEQYWSFIRSARQGWGGGATTPDKKGSSGGDFYRTANNRVGKHFYNVVDRAVRNGGLLYTEAYRLTGLYGKTYEQYGSR